MKNLTLKALAGCAALALAGCGDMGEIDLVQPGQPVGAIEIRNISNDRIVDLRINPCEARMLGGPDYGYDRLNGRIEPGATRSFPASPGCYHARALVGGGLIMGPAERFMVMSVRADAATVWEVNR